LAEASSTDAPASGSPRAAIATTMYHSIETIFWLQQTEVESNELGSLGAQNSMGKARRFPVFSADLLVSLPTDTAAK
jgi:hypothetical protein